MLNYIPVEKDNIPERFEIDLGIESFLMEFHYNEPHDFFTCNLYDTEKNPIILGEKLIINKPLWSEFSDVRLPGPTIIPLDESNNTDRITFGNFGVSVFLCIDDIGEEE